MNETTEKKMGVIVYLPNKQVKEIFLNPHDKIGDVIKESSPVSVNLTDDLEDQEVYILDQEDELSKDAKVAGHKAFVVHRCKKISININYPGKAPFSKLYPPSISVKKIKKDAIEAFSIDGTSGHSLELFASQSQDSKLNNNYPIGTYSEYPVCSLTVYLADPNAFAG